MESRKNPYSSRTLLGRGEEIVDVMGRAEGGNGWGGVSTGTTIELRLVRFRVKLSLF